MSDLGLLNAIPEHLRRAVVVAERVDERLDMQERMRHYRVPGISLAVVNDGKLEAVSAFGHATSDSPLTPQTRFQAGSISKPVTATAVLSLVEQGHLNLDADVNRQLRTWKLPPHQFRGHVSLRRLLSHSAGTSVTGFPGYPRGTAIPTTKEILDGRPPANTAPVRVVAEPGSSVSYSGGGYVIIQQLIEDVTGDTFANALKHLILEPAGMSDSSFEQESSTSFTNSVSSGHLADGTGVPACHRIYPEQAAAGLWTTASDLAHFAIALMDAWSGSGTLLSKKWAREMLSAQAGIYGLGIRIDNTSGENRFWHTGGAEGFRAHLRFSLDGKAVVAMANGDDGMSLINEVFEGLYSLIGRLAPERRQVHVVEIDPAPYLGKYEYRFEEFSHSLTVASTGPTLEATAPTLWHGSRQWLPESQERFVAPDGATSITFLLNASGGVSGLNWGSYHFRKVS